MNVPFAEPNESETESIEKLIGWLTDSYSLDDLAKDSGVSVSTLRRMRRGFCTERTLGKLQRIIDDLAQDEHESSYMFWSLR